MANTIHYSDQDIIDTTQYAKHFVGCAILTKDNQILLQQRGQDWDAYPGYLAEFGGHIEANESPMQALVRELDEELGARVQPADVISLGAISEKSSNFTELVYVYFWHDKDGTITGCYEGEARKYSTIEEALQHPKMMESVRWLLKECSKLGYFPL